MTFEQLKEMEPLFGSWHIVKLIGEGGFGQVYEIQREEFGTVYKAALKVISIPKNKTEEKYIMSGGMDREAAEAYFRGQVEEISKEFVLMDKVKGHTNIVGYLDHRVERIKDEIGWIILIRMELLKPLNEYLEEHDPDMAMILKLGVDICSAIEVCEKCNIIHRDIKPDNIFLSETNDFKLGDFGIARVMDKGNMASTQIGTKNYLAPEVQRGEKYTSNVDTYSLAMVLYRLLNHGRLPFYPVYPEPIKYSDNEAAMARRLSGEKIPFIYGLSDELNLVLQKATSYDPQNRFKSAGEMRKSLEKIYEELVDTEVITVYSGEFEKSNSDDTETMLMEDTSVENIEDDDTKTELVLEQNEISEEEEVKFVKEYKLVITRVPDGWIPPSSRGGKRNNYKAWKVKK